jgi:SAM-dependent methyltransferase
MKLRYALATLKAADPIALFKIVQDFRSAVRMHFLFAAEQSGLLRELCTPRTRDELIDRLSVGRPEILDALLEVGLSVGELGQKGDRISLKGRRARALSEPRGDPLAAVIEANLTYYNAIYRGTADRLRGGPDDDCLSEIGEVVARFSALAEPMIRDVLSAQLDTDRPLRMLDVGCGTGDYLRSVATLHPRATGVGVEVDPAVATRAEQCLREWESAERFEIVCADILDHKGKVSGPFQLITMLNVVYYFPEDTRVGLFEAIRALLDEGGCFMLVNSMQCRGEDFSAANLNLAVSSMRGCTPLPKRERVLEQLAAAGFVETTSKKLASQTAFWAIVGR